METRFEEMLKLKNKLEEANIPYTLGALWGGLQIRIYADKEKTRELDDVVIHQYSHGYKQGLLETYNLGECDGFETAEQVFKGWMEKYFS